MRLLLLAIALLLVAASFYVDYRWKRWLAEQREARKRKPDEFQR
ncbi:hypothetical protein ACPOL_2317 [Acidisarcina polymorpha]|uniref:Uncharacterized protein n=1 Tax=Acidisarcina polymorpha TaxID=2211140 RepID=A0A2Z5FXQ5_9BACT|nr:hypothetical protein [Acidisarcina polymorpha]AXC11641.1 hypothetical protein ACPOL_2317 [Acidisarcina polymorpha]